MRSRYERYAVSPEDREPSGEFEFFDEFEQDAFESQDEASEWEY